jgi:hypothetical protein
MADIFENSPLRTSQSGRHGTVAVTTGNLDPTQVAAFSFDELCVLARCVADAGGLLDGEFTDEDARALHAALDARGVAFSDRAELLLRLLGGEIGTTRDGEVLESAAVVAELGDLGAVAFRIAALTTTLRRESEIAASSLATSPEKAWVGVCREEGFSALRQHSVEEAELWALDIALVLLDLAQRSAGSAP